MTTPANGTSWRAGGFGDVDNRFNQRGGLAAILIRDNRGAATNISPWVVGSPPTLGWSPFAQDGTPRADLFAAIRVSGEWVTNPDPNEGFWMIGATTEDGGPERAADIKEDSQMILQSNMPFDTDLTSEGMVINFTGVETLKPLMKRLRMNLPLSDSSGNPIVEDPGTENFNIGKPIDVESPERQIILMFARKKAGKFVYTAEGYSLGKLTNIGNFRRSKTDPDAGELGYTILPDPFFIGKDAGDPSSEELVPLFYAEWVAGDGWTAIGGVPLFAGAAPLATQTGATTATVSLLAATGGGDPFTYVVQKSVSPFSVWTTATVGSTTLDTPTADFIQFGLTGLVTATGYKFRVVAEGSNGQTSTSASSNLITTA